MTTIIQSIIFDKSIWSKPKAREWLKKNNFKFSKVDTTGVYHRFRQRKPLDDYTYKTAYSKDLLGKKDKTIKFVIAHSEV
jgi:hypothetical protein